MAHEGRALYLLVGACWSTVERSPGLHITRLARQFQVRSTTGTANKRLLSKCSCGQWEWNGCLKTRQCRCAARGNRVTLRIGKGGGGIADGNKLMKPGREKQQTKTLVKRFPSRPLRRQCRRPSSRRSPRPSGNASSCPTAKVRPWKTRSSVHLVHDWMRPPSTTGQ